MYLELFDLIFANTGRQFMICQFKQYVANMGIIIKNITIEAYHFIGLVKFYYSLFYQIYIIITIEISGNKPELIL